MTISLRIPYFIFFVYFSCCMNSLVDITHNSDVEAALFNY